MTIFSVLYASLDEHDNSNLIFPVSFDLNLRSSLECWCDSCVNIPKLVVLMMCLFDSTE